MLLLFGHDSNEEVEVNGNEKIEDGLSLVDQVSLCNKRVFVQIENLVCMRTICNK